MILCLVVEQIYKEVSGGVITAVEFPISQSSKINI